MRRPLSNLKKAKLSSDGEKVLKVLQEQYGMEREAAIRLMQDGGMAFAMAMLGGTAINKGQTVEQLQSEVRKLKIREAKLKIQLRDVLSRLQEGSSYET